MQPDYDLEPFPEMHELREAASSFDPRVGDELELRTIPAYKLSDTQATPAFVSVHIEDDKPGFAVVIILDPPVRHRFVVKLDELRTVF
jgi:hypothetical protein